MPIYVDDIKTYLWRSAFFIPIRYTKNKFYDDLLSTYDENGDFVIDDIPFCDESEQRHEKIVICRSVPWK
jgi:predicted DNA binding protein